MSVRYVFQNQLICMSGIAEANVLDNKVSIDVNDSGMVA